MKIYDSKTPGVHQNGERYILPTFPHCDEAIFKASYIVADDLTCDGKVSALFDLIVFGDVSVQELEVKGRFICTGKCSITGELVVQNDIWVDELCADTIDSHDQIVAQQLDARHVKTDGNIVVAKTLAVEERAQCDANVICGETAFGAGKIIAKMVLTGEPLDLDRGEAALSLPNKYDPAAHSITVPSSLAEDILNLADVKSLKDKLDAFRKKNAYENYLDLLAFIIPDSTLQERFSLWKRAITIAEDSFSNGLKDFTSIDTLIWLTDAVYSGYFNDWSTILNLHENLKRYFSKVVRCEPPSSGAPQPAKRLAVNDIVIHDSFGRGVVKTENTISKISEVLFDTGHSSKFLLPSALSHFKFVGVCDNEALVHLKDSIECNLEGYGEWLQALNILRGHYDKFDSATHALAFELVFANLGLKAKFVTDRLNDKEWIINGQ